MSIESQTIKACIRAGEESGFVAECIELPVTAQGRTLDKTIANLREAISLHLESEDLATLGFTPDMLIVVTYEMAIPLSSVNRKSWFKQFYILASVLVVILWLSAPFALSYIFSTWAERGQFGDLFGSVNALFSGLAFVALIYTIHLQRQELSLQRMELKLQREEMVASRGELAAQVAVQKHLLRATIGQIKVSAEQARIAAIETSCVHNNNARGLAGEGILTIADKIGKIANELEND